MSYNRHRTRTSGPFSQTSKYWGKLSYSTSEYLIGSFSVPGPDYTYESISDVSGKFAGSSVVRPCAHTKVTTSYKALSFPTPSIPVNMGNWTAYRTHRMDGPAGFRTWADPSGLTVGHPDYRIDGQRWVNSRVRALKEHVPTNVSIPNFLWELKDLGPAISAIKSLSKMSRELADHRSILRTPQGLRPVQDGTIETVRRALQTAGERIRKDPKGSFRDAYLQYQFGFKPLVNDIRAFAAMQYDVQKRLNDLRRTYKRLQRIRRSNTFSGPEITSAWQYRDSLGWGSVYCRAISSVTYKVTFGCNLIHDLEVFPDAEQRWEVAAAALGLNKPLSALYDAVPFSFLLDYVSNIRDQLDAVAEYPVFPGTFTLSGAWSTTKVVQRTGVQFEVRSDLGTFPLGIGIESTKQSFTRSAGFDTTNGVLLDGNVSLTQLLNTIALFA